MTSNSVYNKIIKFAIQTEEISLSEFQDLLESSSRNNKIRVEWETLEGNTDYYYMWWEPGPIGNGIEGGTDTKAAEGMFNIKTTLNSKTGRAQWRTLSLQTVSKARFNNKLYKIK
jgi:hypothetical protein